MSIRMIGRRRDGVKVVLGVSAEDSGPALPLAAGMSIGARWTFRTDLTVAAGQHLCTVSMFTGLFAVTRNVNAAAPPPSLLSVTSTTFGP